MINTFIKTSSLTPHRQGLHQHHRQDIIYNDGHTYDDSDNGIYDHNDCIDAVLPLHSIHGLGKTESAEIHKVLKTYSVTSTRCKTTSTVAECIHPTQILRSSNYDGCHLDHDTTSRSVTLTSTRRVTSIYDTLVARAKGNRDERRVVRAACTALGDRSFHRRHN
jgi:hypothetical protein